jgi:hypothetical protein
MTIHRAPVTLLALGIAAGVLLPGSAAHARSLKVDTTLAASGADADAAGDARLTIRSRRGTLDARLEVRVRRLAPAGQFEIVLDGVRIGELATSGGGNGKLRFRSRPRGKDLLLGVDPRGRELVIRDATGAVVLGAPIPDDSIDPTKVRCCLPDDSGTECEDRTAAECSAAGGVDLGPGSCLPNPCADAPVPGDDVVCCLPDDSGPECEDRTAAECSAQGGISLGAGTCLPNPCEPFTPPADDDIRCCLPDDSGPECEDRTVAECAAEGGVNIGAGVCAPDTCLGSGSTTTTVPGGTTTTTVPRPAAVRVTCERRSDRSRVSVDGNDLASGSYAARIVSGGNEALSPARPTVGDEVEHDFDSEPDDIAAGATPIAADFLVGSPVSVTGQLLDAGGAVVAEATVACDVG